MIKLYQNKEWLYNKYLGEMLSIYQISKLCRVCWLTIWRWLKIFNITIRSISEGNHLRQVNHCNLPQETIEWLNGELLGDGCIYQKSKYSAKFLYTSKHPEYIKYISKILKTSGVEQGGKIRKYCHKKVNGNYCYFFSYQSRYYEELLPIRKKWYPNGKKMVPKDIELTPLTCRQWYIGDGGLPKAKSIVLYTCGFTISDVKWLVKQLIELGFKATRQLCKNSIHISTHSTKDFLDYIGKCPVKCYKYKWAY